jgi:adenylate cyclase
VRSFPYQLRSALAFHHDLVKALALIRYAEIARYLRIARGARATCRAGAYFEVGIDLDRTPCSAAGSSSTLVILFGSMTSHTDWLLSTARFAPSIGRLLSGLARRLCDDGFDLTRMNVQPATLHPEIAMMLYVWRSSEQSVEANKSANLVLNRTMRQDFGLIQEIGLGHREVGKDIYEADAFRASPLFKLHSGAPIVRARIPPHATSFEYPILKDLAAVGATDYVAWPLKFSDGTRSYFSLTTRREGGFSDAQIAELEAMLDPLAMCVEIHVRAHIARSLLHTYLGRGPGEAVLAGSVQRGDVRELEAALWFSDLRGFTSASSTLPADALVALLNRYFGILAKPITAHDGEILKFIGDAVLAVFPVTEARSRADACAAALRAAVAANAELDALNADRAAQALPPLEHSIGLHVGTVEYGNIGANRRLDFTVIGQAVNIASRIESLCASLGRRTLASAEVAALTDGDLRVVGTFELKGLQGEYVVHGF